METLPSQTKTIVDSRAEIGLHGYSHEGAYAMTSKKGTSSRSASISAQSSRSDSSAIERLFTRFVNRPYNFCKSTTFSMRVTGTLMILCRISCHVHFQISHHMSQTMARVPRSGCFQQLFLQKHSQVLQNGRMALWKYPQAGIQRT
jgi:hypothetical protein